MTTPVGQAILLTTAILFSVGLWQATHPRLDPDLPVTPSVFKLEAAPDLTEAPIQKRIQKEVIEVGDFRILPQASFAFDGLVIARARYRQGRESQLSPIDLGIAWGQVAAHPQILDLKARQMGRFLYYGRDWSVLGSHRVITMNTANMHMIPANAEVRKRLLSIQKGDKVRVVGRLVNVRAQDGWRWISSQTRSDTGNGACEIVLVDEIQVYRG